MSESFLLWRAWQPLYAFPAVYSALQQHAIGGTCSQLLWHAKALVADGHRVQVLGVSADDVIEDGVEFVGAANQPAQVAAIRSGRIRRPFSVFLEGGYASAPFFRHEFPTATIVQVGQNIDRWSGSAVLKVQRYVDIYAMVSPGQLALYSVKLPKLRSKMLLLRNAVPWATVHSRVERVKETDTVAWVGGWTKKGLRDWAQAMERLLREHPGWRWELFGPSYGRGATGLPVDIFQGLYLPADRVATRSLPMAAMLRQLTAAKIVGVSLGNECGPTSALDGHAMRKAVVSGNDVIYSYVNPTRTGLRARNATEIYAAVKILMESEYLRRSMGDAGEDLIRSEFTEAAQASDMQRLVQHIEVLQRVGVPAMHAGSSAWGETREDVLAALHRKLRRWRARGTMAEAGRVQ